MIQAAIINGLAATGGRGIAIYRVEHTGQADARLDQAYIDDVPARRQVAGCHLHGPIFTRLAIGVNPGPQVLRFHGPSQWPRGLPALDVAVCQRSDLFGVFQRCQALLQDQLTVPQHVQVVRFVVHPHVDAVTALILWPAHVQRLMHVPDEMREKPQRLDLRLAIQRLVL